MGIGLVPSSCSSALQNIQCFANSIGNTVSIFVAVLVGLGIIFYFYGIIRDLYFFENKGSVKNLNSLQLTLMWGLLALFLILSVWGVLRLAGMTLFGTSNFNSLW